MADVESLVEVGFKRGITEKVCAMITRKAESIGVFDLKRHHEKALLGKVGNIVSLIVPPSTSYLLRKSGYAG
jgi:hypothetical protein